MNDLDNLDLAKHNFSYRDILGQDRWEVYAPTASLTLVGAATYVGRYRIVGKQCFLQITAIAATSIASTAGTHYFNLPITAVGLGGMATMTDDTTNIAVGTCHIDVATSRCYTPTLVASGDLFTINGWYEVA